MDITSAQGFLQFITQVKSSRGGSLEVSDLISELKNKGSFPGKGAQLKKTSGNEVESSEEPVSQEAVAENSDVNEESTSPESVASSQALDELATLYVQQYEAGAGLKLSDEVFEQKKSEVIDLYSRLGANRLDDIVFSNDVDQTA